MGFWNRLTNFFTRKKQEDEAERQQKKWWQFWKRKPKEAKEDEVIPEADQEEAPWRVDASGLMDEAEKRKREQEEEEQKKADEEKKRQQYEKARDTYNRRYGTSFNQEEYDQMWDFFGGNPDILEFFPSEELTYAAEYAKQAGIPFDRFKDIVLDVCNQCRGRGLNRYEAAQMLWNELDKEAAARGYTGWKYENSEEVVYD